MTEVLISLLEEEIEIGRKRLCSIIGEEAYKEIHRLMDEKFKECAINFDNFAEVKGDE